MARIRKINVSQVEGNDNGVLPAGTIVAYENDVAGYTLRVHNGITAGGVPFNGSNGIVNRTVNFPNGDVGDTAGTLANDDGVLYFCTADYTDLNQYINTPYSLETSVEFAVGQTGGTLNSATISRNANAAVLFILENGGLTGGAWSITMADSDFGGAQTCTQVGFNVDDDIDFLWTHRNDDPNEIPAGSEFTVTYTGTLNRPAIWERVIGSNRIEYFDEVLDYTSSVELTGNFRVDVDDAHLDVDGDGYWSLGSNNYDTKIFSIDNTTPNPADIIIRANDNDWKFDSEGNLTLPTGGDILDSNGNSVLGGATGDQNVWIQTFETVEGAPADVVAAALSVEYDSEGNLICLFSHAEDFNIGVSDGGNYFSVAKIATTGTIVWQVRFAAGFRTDGWGLALDLNGESDFIYVAGTVNVNDEVGETKSMLTKMSLIDGEPVWSKVYDFGFNSDSPVVDVATGDPVMVGYADDGSENYITVTKIDSTDGSVFWSKKLNGQGYEYAYGMGVGPSGEVVAVGYISQLTELIESYPVTPQTGSGMEVLVINRSDLNSATFTNSWKVAGTGILEYANVSFINTYTGLTSTVREGSGATFNIDDNGSGIYFVGVVNGGTNYLPGHEIKILGSALGGADGVNDCVITVMTVDTGVIVNVSGGGTAPGSTPASYNGVTGTNYNVGSGLVFNLELDSGNTYTEHNYTFQSVGANYVNGDVVVIPGTQLGGTSPANDLTATVSVANGGAVVAFNTFSGTQQTTTYRILVSESEVDFSGTGTWTLNEVNVDQDDRMLVVKYNSSGAIQWQKAVQFDDGYDCQGADCDIDSAGNIYVTGQYDLTDGPGVALSIIKFNSSGVAQWSRRVTGNCETFGTSIVVGGDNNLYLSGMTAIQNPDFPGSGSPYADTHSVLAKYSPAGAVLWQRLLENSTTWSFSGNLFGPVGGSNLAVKDGYVALAGAYGSFDDAIVSASLAQVNAAGTVFSVGNWDFVAANFSGTLFNDASDITVVNAGKTDSDLSGDITTTDSETAADPSNFLIGTIYRESGGDDRLVNSGNELVLGSTGTVTLPQGGTISEGYVTSNPTIQLTPASPDVASQKLVIKGGNNFNVTDNGIDLGYSNITAQVGDTITFNVNSTTYANQTLYWWIYPEGAGIGDSESGTVTLTDGYGTFSILIDSDDYEFTVRVSPINGQYDPANVGVESGLINADAPTYPSEHHLHLTTGDLSETSIFLGTDNHNVRTTVDGGIQVTTETTVALEPSSITISGADIDAVNTIYNRAPSNTPTWVQSNGDPNIPYIQFVEGEWGIFAPEIDPVIPIYVNTGTLTAPIAQWNNNPPYGSIAPLGVYTYPTPPVQEWKFGVDGSLTLPSNGVIQTSDVDGIIKTVIAVPHTEDRDFGDWTSAEYTEDNGNGAILIIDPSPSFRQYLSQRIDQSVSTTMTINGNISLTYTSCNIQPTQITVYVNEAPESGPITVTGIVINTVAENRMGMSVPDSYMEFISGTGWGVNIESKLTGDVNIRAGDDIVIKAGDKFRSDSSGGDIDIVSGRGGDADHDDVGGDGGDLDIIASNGGNASASYSAGDGGVFVIRSGSGGEANSGGNRQAGEGANLSLYAGDGGYNDGNVTLGKPGGDVRIFAGSSTNNSRGGDILLQAGAGGTTQGGGTITLRTRAADNITDREITLDSQGKTTLPGAVITGTVTRPATTGIPAIFSLSTSNNPNFTPGIYPNLLVGFTGRNVTLDIVIDESYNISIENIRNASPATFVLGDSAVLNGELFGGTSPADNLTIVVFELVPVVIDLTKSINKLTDGEYELADGIEGQIMYLVAQDGTVLGNVSVSVANSRISGSVQGGNLLPFRIYENSGDGFYDSTGICTLIFTDNAWQQQGGAWD